LVEPSRQQGDSRSVSGNIEQMWIRGGRMIEEGMT
jgi:hypothetical protein